MNSSRVSSFNYNLMLISFTIRILSRCPLEVCQIGLYRGGPFPEGLVESFDLTLINRTQKVKNASKIIYSVNCIFFNHQIVICFAWIAWIESGRWR